MKTRSPYFLAGLTVSVLLIVVLPVLSDSLQARQARSGRTAGEQIVPVYLTDPLQMDTTLVLIETEIQAIRAATESLKTMMVQAGQEGDDEEDLLDVWIPLLLVIAIFQLLLSGSLVAAQRTQRRVLQEQQVTMELLVRRVNDLEQALLRSSAQQQPRARAQRAARVQRKPKK